MTTVRVRDEASPSSRFPIWNLVIGTYLEIGTWKFNPVSRPTRQIVKAQSLPNTLGLQPVGLRGLCSMTTQVRIPALVEFGKRVANPLSLLGAALNSDC